MTDDIDITAALALCVSSTQVCTGTCDDCEEDVVTLAQTPHGILCRQCRVARAGALLPAALHALQSARAEVERLREENERESLCAGEATGTMLAFKERCETLTAELESVRRDCAMFDIDRCNLRMALNAAEARLAKLDEPSVGDDSCPVCGLPITHDEDALIDDSELCLRVKPYCTNTGEAVDWRATYINAREHSQKMEGQLATAIAERDAARADAQRSSHALSEAIGEMQRAERERQATVTLLKGAGVVADGLQAELLAVIEERSSLSARVLELESAQSAIDADTKEALAQRGEFISRALTAEARVLELEGDERKRDAARVEFARDFKATVERDTAERIAAWLEREASDNTEWEVSQLRSNAYRTAATGGVPVSDYDCLRCEDAALINSPGTMRRFIVCPTCGNKRCPKATHHDNACTGSNEPGQAGSDYALGEQP